MIKLDYKTASPEQIKNLIEYTERLEAIAARLCRGDFVFLDKPLEELREVLKLGSRCGMNGWYDKHSQTKAQHLRRIKNIW